MCCLGHHTLCCLSYLENDSHIIFLAASYPPLLKVKVIEGRGRQSSKVISEGCGLVSIDDLFSQGENVLALWLFSNIIWSFCLQVDLPSSKSIRLPFEFEPCAQSFESLILERNIPLMRSFRLQHSVFPKPQQNSSTAWQTWTLSSVSL